MRLSLVFCILTGACWTVVISVILSWVGFNSFEYNTAPAAIGGLVMMVVAGAVSDAVQRRRMA